MGLPCWSCWLRLPKRSPFNLTPLLYMAPISTIKPQDLWSRWLNMAENAASLFITGGGVVVYAPVS